MCTGLPKKRASLECSKSPQKKLPSVTARVAGRARTVMKCFSVEFLLGEEDEDNKDELEDEDVAKTDVETEEIL